MKYTQQHYPTGGARSWGGHTSLFLVEGFRGVGRVWIPQRFHSAVLGCKVGTRKLSGEEMQVLTMGRQVSVHRSGEGKGIQAGYPCSGYAFTPGIPLRFPIVVGITQPREKWCQN